ncbi:unnamed protein product [Meganyctiphanes norvegica]|uniref:4-nitrophenylphosphatase n=1 Tax=Meganyctiphanes norvegica TaxID=48144 RepID=A0AAV2RMK0_MEGNR
MSDSGLPTDATRLPTLLTKDNINIFLDSFDNILADCDGVLWHGPEVIEGSRETLQYLLECNKRVIYITNDSNHTRQQITEKVNSKGFPGTQEHVMCPAFTLGHYLSAKKFHKKVYVVGSQGVVDELKNFGISSSPIGHDKVTDDDNLSDVMGRYSLDPDVGAVTVGFDLHISLPKLAKATSYASNPECLFLSMAPDENHKEQNNPLVLPGSGAFARCIAVAAQRDPIVIGKPSVHMFQALQEIHQLDPTRTIIVGDRWSDIRFGHNNGLKTLLVLSGFSKLKDLEDAVSETWSYRPHFYINKLGDIMSLMKPDS